MRQLQYETNILELWRNCDPANAIKYPELLRSRAVTSRLSAIRHSAKDLNEVFEAVLELFETVLATEVVVPHHENSHWTFCRAAPR